MKSRLTTSALVLAAVAIAVNVVGGETVARLQLPIYGDSIGTVLAGALGGPVLGALVGALTNLVAWPLVSGRLTAMPFALTAAVIGAMAGLAGRRHLFRSVGWTALAGIVTGLAAAVVSTPIAVALGGVTGGGTDVIVGVLRALGAGIWQAALGQGVVSDPLDKLASFLAVYIILRVMPDRLRARYSDPWQAEGRTRAAADTEASAALEQDTSAGTAA